MNVSAKTGRANQPIGGQAARPTAGVTIASSIAFEAVSHHFGDRQILRDVSVQAAPGEVSCLLGPSGSGKTTLLRLAAGLTSPSRGRILIDGREVSTPDRVTPPENRGVGMVFQDFALFPHLTALENVEFGLIRLERRERKEHALHILRTVGVAGEAHKYPHALSGGEQQRVALARALAPKPGIVLMDEPFSGLDSRLRESVREETLALLRSTRSTVLMVTHDPEEAMKIGDRIALMNRGEIVQYGTGSELYNHPESLFSARFFSPLNVLPAMRREGFVETALGRLPLDRSTMPAEGEIRVCVRPSDFIIRIPKSGGKTPTAANVVYVHDRRFLGEIDHLTVVHPGLSEQLELRCPAGVVPEGATEFELNIDPAQAMVFPVDAD